MLTGKLPEPLERLVHELSRLPTIGRKSAQRLAFHILKSPDEQALALAVALQDVKSRIRFCSHCFFITERELCSICSDSRRDRSVICVVEEPLDVVAFEKSGSYLGLYHVLLGRLSPIHGVFPENLKLAELMVRLRAEDAGVGEVIIATNPNADGDATALLLSRQIEPLGIRVTRLGVGLSIGSSLEFADELTLRKALESRREL